MISKDGYALTNFHVIANTGAFMKCGLNDGVLYDAVKVGIDPTGDVAIIKLLGRNDFPVAKLGDSDRVKMGDPLSHRVLQMEPKHGVSAGFPPAPGQRKTAIRR